MLAHLCAFLFIDTLTGQEADSSINISDFQYSEIQGIPIILDETGENTFYLNERIPEYLSDIKINNVMLDGALGIPLGSYFLPKLLPKSSHADSVKNTSQIYYRKGDYDYSDLSIGLQIESSDSGFFRFQGFRRSPPQLYQNSEDELQNHLISFERIMDNSNIGVGFLYHSENVNLPVNLSNTSRKVESFHGGLGIEQNWGRLAVGAEQAFQFTYSNHWDNKVSYFTMWNQLQSSYEVGEDFTFHFRHHYKIHSTEKDNEVVDVPSQIISSLIEYDMDGYSIRAGISAYESSLIPIGSFNWKWNNNYLSVKRNYEFVFTQTADYHTNVKPFSTDALIIGYENESIKGEVELFHNQPEEKLSLGMRAEAEINLSWLDLRHTSGVYNLGSENTSPHPVDMYSYSSLIFSPNVWRWKKPRYQPFIGAESTFIQYSGRMGIDPMEPAILTLQSMDPYSSFLVNMEYGLLVNQFKISYRWVKFNMFENTANNSINPDSYSILPIRHLEIVWQFWN
ncbi:MAG: hypothetical protein H8E85_06580 [Candidatus Marinimicrobia bacterium]|nr:hypothetical protein [Candidatus Neomarinimicrobiota bacterium]